MSDSAAKLSFEIEVAGDINEQIKGIANEAANQAKSDFKAVGEAAVHSVKTAVSQSSTQIQKEMELISKYGMDAAQKIIESGKSAAGSVADVPEYIANAFQLAENKTELLYQKMDSLVVKADTQREHIKQLVAQYAELSAAGAPDADLSELSSQIESAKDKLIGLQDQIFATESKIEKAENSAKESVKSAEATVKSTINSATSQAQKAVNQASTTTKKAAQSAGEAVSSSAKKAQKQADSAFGKIGKSASKLGKSIKSAAKSVFLMAGLYAVFRTIKSGVEEAAMSNKKFAKSLNETKANLSVAFQPIIQTIVPALSTLMSWLAVATKQVAAFISGLFGTTYKKSLSASKKLQDVEKKAKSTSKSLLSFDEVNTLNKNDNNDSSSDTEGIDFSGIDASGTQAAESLAQKFKTSFTNVLKSAYEDWDFKSLFENVKRGINKVNWDSISNKCKNIFNGLKPIASSALNGIKKISSSAFNAIGTYIGGLTSVGGKTFDTLLSGVQKWLDGSKEKISSGITDISNNLSAGFNNLSSFFNKIFNAVGNSVDRCRDRVGTGISDLLTGYSDLGLAIGTITSDMWSRATEALSNWATNSEQRLGEFFDNLQLRFADFSSLFGGIFSDIGNSVSKWWETTMGPIFTQICDAFMGVADIVIEVWNEWIDPIISVVINTVKELWDKHLKSLFENLLGFFSSVWDNITTLWNNVLQPVVKWIVEKLGPPIKNVVKVIGNIVSDVIGTIIDVISGIIRSLKGILDFVTGIFSGNWKKAWNGIKDIFGGIWDAIYGVIKGVVNLIIDGINFLWSGIYTAVSGIVNTIGDVSGVIGSLLGQDWSFSIPDEPPLIPRLYTGGLATAPTLAMVGDNAGAAVDPEVIAPLSKLRDYMGTTNNSEVLLLLQKIYELIERGVFAIENLNFGDAKFSIDGKTLARIIFGYSDDTTVQNKDDNFNGKVVIA